MTLRNKTLLMQIAFFAIFLLLIYILFALFLDRSTKQLDKDRMELNLERVRSSLESEANELYALSRIWSDSDATWNFMSEATHSFSDINLDRSIINTLGVSSMIFFDKACNVKLFKDFTSGGDPSAPVNEFEEIVMNNAKSSGLLAYIPISGLKGVVASNGKPMFFSVQPIYNSNMDRESAGYLLMTKSISPNLINRLSRRLHFYFEVEPASEQEMRNGVKQELVISRDSDQDMVNGRMLVRDVGGDPIFWIVGSDASDTTIGINTWGILTFCLLSVAALCLCLLGDQLTGLLIWNRIGLTRSALQEARDSKAKPELHDDGRGDELSYLVLAINDSYESIGFSKE